MAFIENTATTSVIKVRLTNIGRKYLSNGIDFNITKYAFGDSEVDYTSLSNCTGSPITFPNIKNVDLKTKVYYRGTIPNGTPYVSVDPYFSLYEIPKYSTISIRAKTVWYPVVNYYEEYKIINLGPLEDYNFEIVKSNYNEFQITTNYITGSTQLKVLGLTTNKYLILDVNVVDSFSGISVVV